MRARRESACTGSELCSRARASSSYAVPVLEYEITIDDLIAYNLYGATSVAAAKKQRDAFRVSLTVLVFLALTAMIAMDGTLLEGALVGLAGAATIWFVWPPVWVWATRRHVMRHAKAGSLGIAGPCRIWLDQSGVHDATPNGTSSVTWAGIDRVEETATHAFIFVGPLQAYVIPKRIGESAVAQFLTVVRAGLVH